MKVESAIIGFIFSLIYKLQDAYERSLTHRLLESFANKAKIYFQYSRIWRFIKRKGKIAEAWENSFTLEILDKLINLPSILFRPFYIRFREAFEASFVIKILKYLTERYTLLLGACLAIIVVVPDISWYNKYSLIMGIMLFMLFVIKTIIQDKQRFNIKSLELPIFIFWIFVIFGTINSVLPGTSLSYFVLYIITFTFFILVISSASSFRGLDLMIKLLLMGVLFTALYGIYQWKIVGVPVNPSITDTRLNPGLSRISSTMGNENVYGELLVLTLPFFAAAIINGETLIKKLFFPAALIPVIVALFLTGSRSAWISFAFSAFVFVFLKNRKLVPLAILLGILSIPMLPDSIIRRIMTLFNPHDNSAKYRTLIFEHAKPMLLDYWVTGVGLGSDTFNSVFKRYLSFQLPSAAHTHNLYLQLWLEMGIVSIISFLWYFFRIFKNSLTRIFRHGQENVKNILIAGISALSGIFVMGLADHIWFYNRLMLIFWVIAGTVIACLNILNEEGEYSEGSYAQTNESN